MIFSDIVALARMGYTPADVREFIEKDNSADGSDRESPDEKTEDKKTDPEPDAEKDPEPDAEKDPEPDTLGSPNKSTGDAGAIDYKKLYEKAKNDLEKAQIAATKKPLPERDDDQTILNKALAGFM